MTGCGLSTAEAARRSLGDERGQAVVGAWFRERALARGYDEETVERVWRTLTAFGAFGFCKAHAASFALPTYQSAWLKRHHTAAFYAGVLTHDPGMYPKRVILDDARHFGVPILPLDVNRSAAHWRVEPVREGGPFGIRVALSEVRGIRDAEVDAIIAGRPYTSLTDFWSRAGVSRPTAERLALAGAFDGVYAPDEVARRDLLRLVGALDRAAGRAPVVEGQLPIGGGEGESPLEIDLTGDVPAGELPPMTPAEVVEAELDILGMDVSRHVLTFYDGLLDALGVVRAVDLPGRPDGSEVLVAGVKVATQTPAVRSGRRVIFATLDDATGPVDLAFFESVQDRCAATVFGSWLLVARGRLRRSGARAVSITAYACWDLNALYGEWLAGGPDAARAAMAVPAARGRPVGSRVVHPTGFAMSPYSDVGHAGPAPGRPPKGALWHTSRGSSGPAPR